MSETEKTFEAYFAQFNIPFSAWHIGYNTNKDMPNMYEWKVSIGDFTTSYFMGAAYKGRKPTLTEVMYALLGDADLGSEDFNSFCDNLGYNNDSRKAYASWQACQETAERINATFTTEQLEKMREILQYY